MADLRKGRAATEDKGFQRMMAKITGFFNPGPATPPESVPVATQAPHHTSPNMSGITRPPTRVFKKDPDMSRPPPPPRKRRGGGGDDGDGSGDENQSTQPTTPQGRKETSMATATQAPTDWGSNVKMAILTGLMALGAAGTAWIAIQQHSAAGIELKREREKTNQIVAATPGASVSIWGASGPPVAEPATATTRASEVARGTTQPETAIATSERGAASMAVSPCDGRILAVNVIAPGQMREASGGDTGGCLGVHLTERGSFWGTNYELRDGGNLDDYTSDMSLDGGPEATRRWLDSHIGRDIVVVLKNENSRYGQVRFN